MKITEYTALSAASADDILLIVNDPGGSPITNKITVANLFANVAISTATITLKEKSTPANSTQSSTQGHMWFDANYLYISTANNVTKRVALSSF